MKGEGKVQQHEDESSAMIVKQIWTANRLRNFNYLIACPETGEALAIDPLDHQKCLSEAKAMGWDITQVLNTHEHFDHTGGNAEVIAATGARLLAHEKAGDRIEGVDRGLKAGDVVKVGHTVELEVMDTPGHTFCHICMRSHTDQPALFCGDTLFNAGAGNTHSGRTQDLFHTFIEQLAALPADTLVYPGHDYIENNLGFTLDREPDNTAARDMMARVRGQDPANAHVTTMEEEKAINTFFRLASPAVIAHLREKFPDMGENPSEEEVFTRLRELRNDW